ncbi:hypothetical protein LPJ78_000245 [Coemansia sp. RSA 989]|nr:hypothetical protein LPJ78_000245 [Coemansia sp. RSA 989]KAJ2633080.1 hypothetical protein H4R22_000759 [Coemansia sp. RSA 1290]KAJ2650468.1 hypothetical protein IWW40_002431 [Coemansia sp. RSA 1250]
MSIQLGLKCTCVAKQAAECYLRSHGVVMLDSNDVIVHVDAEAVEVLRGPTEEWDGMRTQVLHDGTASGSVHQYWEYLEHIAIGSTDKYHYLVVKRKSDNAVCWVQTCIHELTAKDGQLMRLWHVRDVTGAARCLEMSQSMADGEYTLSLEDDGLPHSSLLTQVPGTCSHGMDVRNQLAAILDKVVATEQFAVLQLTGFGAIDTVFPRRILGWNESDLLDRSFIGLLCAEDRGFFCQALRRCQRDGIPQRLALKLGNAADTYIDCDVTVLMPETVQQPVLVVCANDQAPLASAAASAGQDDALCAQQDSTHTVGREIFPPSALLSASTDVHSSWPYARRADVQPNLSEIQALSSPPEFTSASLGDDRAMQPAALSISTCSQPPIGTDTLESTSLNTLASPLSPRGDKFNNFWSEEKHSDKTANTTQLLFDRLADADTACDRAAGLGRCTVATDAGLVSPTLPVRRSDTVSTATSLPEYPDISIDVDIPMAEIFTTKSPLVGSALSYSTDACEQYSPTNNTLVSALLETNIDSANFGAATQSPQQKSC